MTQRDRDWRESTVCFPIQGVINTFLFSFSRYRSRVSILIPCKCTGLTVYSCIRLMGRSTTVALGLWRYQRHAARFHSVNTKQTRICSIQMVFAFLVDFTIAGDFARHVFVGAFVQMASWVDSSYIILLPCGTTSVLIIINQLSNLLQPSKPFLLCF